MGVSPARWSDREKRSEGFICCGLFLPHPMPRCRHLMWKSFTTCAHVQIVTRQMRNLAQRNEMTWVSPSLVLDLRWGSKPLIPVTSAAGAGGQYSGHVTGEFSHVPGLYYIYLLHCSTERSGYTLCSSCIILLLPLCDL